MTAAVAGAGAVAATEAVAAIAATTQKADCNSAEFSLLSKKMCQTCECKHTHTRTHTYTHISHIQAQAELPLPEQLTQQESHSKLSFSCPAHKTHHGSKLLAHWLRSCTG